MLCVSHSTIDSGYVGSRLVQQEAIHICSNNVWSGFLGILALCKITEREIICHYPTAEP